MIKIPKEAGFPKKREGDHSSSDYQKAKASSSSSSIKPQWVRLKDPRIVRVARAYGGKDRHSKVCTIRGLRDRRVRLSVPTAIQLYDLQERLGFNQPSKVIDWLLDAAKHEIDELPPLPPLNLALIHHHAILTANSKPNEEDGWEASNNTFWKLTEPKEASSSGEMVGHDHNNTFWKLMVPKEASSSGEAGHDHKEKANNEEVKQGRNINNSEFYHGVQVMPHHDHPSLLGYQWVGSGGGGEVSQTDLQSLNVVPFSSTLSLCTGDYSSHFPSHFGAMDNIPRQINNSHYYHHMLSSGPNLYPIPMAQSTKPFGFSMMTPNGTERQSHNHQDFPPK